MNYAEAIVTLAEHADLKRAQAWFEERGFQTLPMKMGLLASGGQDLFRQVFATTEDEMNARAERDVSLHVPTSISNVVDSITIRRLPSIEG